MDPAAPSNTNLSSVASVTSVPSTTGPGNQPNPVRTSFLGVPREIRDMIYHLLLTPNTSDKLHLHRTMRALRSQFIHTGILYANRQVNQEAELVLYKKNVICLSAKDILCLDDAEKFETTRQQLWRNLQQITLDGVLPDNLSCRFIPAPDLRHGITGLPSMSGLIDPSIFKRFEKVHVELNYIRFGSNLKDPYRNQINLRLRDLEAEYDIFEIRSPRIVKFLRKVQMLKILARVISQSPQVQSLSLDLLFLIQELNPGQALVLSAQQEREPTIVRHSMDALDYRMRWFDSLWKLSNVEDFNMQLYPRAGESDWESTGRLFDVPPKCIEELAAIKSCIKEAYAAQKRLKPGQELNDDMTYLLATIQIFDSTLESLLDSGSGA